MNIGDLIILVVCFTLGYLIITSEMNADYRPEHIKYVQDTRNGCVLKQSVEIFNQMVHIRKDEYRPKILRIYLCANGLTAANISEE